MLFKGRAVSGLGLHWNPGLFYPNMARVLPQRLPCRNIYGKVHTRLYSLDLGSLKSPKYVWAGKTNCAYVSLRHLSTQKGNSGVENLEDGGSKFDAKCQTDERENLEKGPVESAVKSSSGAVTKTELLDQAVTPLSRIWIHVKWPLTRNNRPFSLDDFTAFASWVVMGQLLWIVLGTTTFVLAAMYMINAFDRFWKTIKGSESEGCVEVQDGEQGSFKDESYLGNLAGRVLTHGLGVSIIFEKGNVVPKLEDGMLKFRNITIVTPPSSSESASLGFRARVTSLNLSLSFRKWYDGKGLIHDIEISGMQAQVAKNGEHISVSPVCLEPQVTTFNSLALSFSGYHESHELQTDLGEHKLKELANAAGSARFSFLDLGYELDHVKIQDSVVEIYEHQESEPFAISIFNCDLPRLRGNRLLIDFFNANIVTGTVNNSMFTIHKHQAYSGGDKTIIFKLDGIDMGSLSTANPKSKLNWLVGGKAEIAAEIRLPNLESFDDNHDESAPAATFGIFSKILNELGDLTNPKPAVSTDPTCEDNLLKGALMAIYETFRRGSDEITSNTDYVIVNAKVKFTGLKASLPPHLPMASSTPVPFITLHNLRSLITYINGLENGKPLVIKTTVIEKASDLYNVDNISQTKMYDAIIGDIYDELLRMIKSDENRILREKSSLWSHSVMSQIILLGLGVMA